MGDLEIDLRALKTSPNGTTPTSAPPFKDIENPSALLRHPFHVYQEPIQPDFRNIVNLNEDACLLPGVTDYLDGLRDQHVEIALSPVSKLVVPSLKGDLAFRLNRHETCARPFFNNFMRYLLGFEEDRTASETQQKDFRMFLWSTGMPRNLLPLLDTYFTEWRDDILGVWNRDHLDLNEEDYGK